MSRSTKQINTAAITHKRAFLGAMVSSVRDKALTFVRADGAKILDIGCGNGLFFAQMLLGRESDISCVGLDYSFDNLQEARRVFADNRVTGCDLVLGNALGLPFQRDTFDQIFCLNTIYNLPSVGDVECLIDQMIQACAPGGSIVFDLRNSQNPFVRFKFWLHNRNAGFPTIAYPCRQIAQILNGKGFMVVRKQAIGLPIRWLAYAYLIEVKIERKNRKAGN